MSQNQTIVILEYVHSYILHFHMHTVNYNIIIIYNTELPCIHIGIWHKQHRHTHYHIHNKELLGSIFEPTSIVALKKTRAFWSKCQQGFQPISSWYRRNLYRSKNCYWMKCTPMAQHTCSIVFELFRKDIRYTLLPNNINPGHGAT